MITRENNFPVGTQVRLNEDAAKWSFKPNRVGVVEKHNRRYDHVVCVRWPGVKTLVDIGIGHLDVVP